MCALQMRFSHETKMLIAKNFVYKTTTENNEKKKIMRIVCIWSELIVSEVDDRQQ